MSVMPHAIKLHKYELQCDQPYLSSYLIDSVKTNIKNSETLYRK